MDIDVEVTEFTLNIPKLMSEAEGKKLWTYAGSEWHRLYKEYVPHSPGGGMLYSTVTITGGNCNATVKHTSPYAHYMYEGVVYGPNVPITQGGVITGYFSPKVPKTKTDKNIHYSQLFNGKACRHWDEAAKPTKGPVLIRSLQGYIDSGKWR